MNDEPKQEAEAKEAGEEAVVDWKAKAEEYLCGWKRAMADYQNREKELSREKKEIARYTLESVAFDLLPILDNLRQAFTHVPEDQKELPWVKGLSYIVKQFDDQLLRYGVTSYSALGEPFDPNRHEALGEEEGEPGVVIREIATGYRADERILRPAKVIVGKSSA